MTQTETAVTTARFYGVGIGPGDPELLTLKAFHTLSAVSVIFVPVTTEGAESLAGRIVEEAIPGISGKFVPLHMPMHRDKTLLGKSWQQAAGSIYETLKEEKDCAFINVGDPMLYGTFVYVLEALREIDPAVNVEVIPGISSVNSIAARTLTELATGNESLAVLSGHPDETTMKTAFKEFDTVVFLKVSSALGKLLPVLEDLNLVEKCTCVRRCFLPEEEIITDIRTLRGKDPDYFSILIMRK